jgi:hypothetical protein
MKTYFQLLSALTLVLALVSACGPAPNPKLQAESAEAPRQQAAPAAAPAVEQAEPARTPVVEEPLPAVKVAPKREVAATSKKAVTAKPAPTPEPVRAGNTTNRPEPVETSSNNRQSTSQVWSQPPVAEPVLAPEVIAPKPVEPPAPRQVRVPFGTLIAVRMIDSVDSETAQAGDTFKGSLDAPVTIDGETVFPEGTEVHVKLSAVQSAGRVRGKSELQLQLDRIRYGGRIYLLESSKYVTTGASQGGRTARSAGLGAAIGAAIGAISGGGKGAIIGASTGAGAGAGVEAIRKGEQVRVDSETRVDFRLEESIEVTLQPASSSSQRNNPSEPPRFGTRQ